MNESKRNETNGILLHKLPSAYVEEALNLSCFSEERIYDSFSDEAGLHIYFSNPDNVVKCARYGKVQVRGHTFNIYLKVTNLTIHKIGTYTGDVKRLIQSAGFQNIIYMYPASKHKEDYRVILSIPEKFYTHNLRRIPCPEKRGSYFRISFHCRLCHNDYHKALECKRQFPSAINLTNSGLQSNTTNIVDVQIFQASSHGSVSDSGHFPTRVLKKELHQNTAVKTPACAEGQLKSQKVFLSERVKNAIFKSGTGVLSPDSLINYINYVRGRKEKKFKEITSDYTRDIRGLIKQLQLVKTNYHISGVRDASSERDINYIDNNLVKRLQSLSLVEEEANLSRKQSGNSRFKNKGSFSKVST